MKTKTKNTKNNGPWPVVAFIVTAAQAQRKEPTSSLSWAMISGMWNIGAYHRGMMAGRTRTSNRLAKEGMLFTTITPRQAARRVERTSS